MQNITNSDIDVSSVLTITEQCTITGSLGTVKIFLLLRQYILCGETAPVEVDCDVCERNESRQQAYWSVCIDSETFLIPKEKACIEGYIRSYWQQDLIKGLEHKWVDQEKDYKQAVYDATGRIINTGNPDFANQDEYDQIQKEKYRNNGKVYGITESEEDQF